MGRAVCVCVCVCVCRGVAATHIFVQLLAQFWEVRPVQRFVRPAVLDESLGTRVQRFVRVGTRVQRFVRVWEQEYRGL